MFTIDLLKGQGIPVKSTPKRVVLGALTVGIPAAVALAMFNCYLQSATAISVQKQAISDYEAKTRKLSNAAASHDSLSEQKRRHTNTLVEVNTALARHTQWSPVLKTIVANLPDSVALAALEVKQQYEKKEVPKKDDSDKTMQVKVPVPMLRLRIAARPELEFDEALRDFRERLLSSQALHQKLKNIIISQTPGTLEGREVIVYELDCLFKPHF